jgi:plastocyanin
VFAILALGVALAACEPRAVPLPATGRTVTVAMEGRGWRTNWFQPPLVRIHSGDAVRWVMGSGSAHSVRFEVESLPPRVRAQLAANFEPASRAHRSARNPHAGGRPGRWDSPMIVMRGDAFTLSFAGIPPGRYPYRCAPHGAVGMRGIVEVVVEDGAAGSRPAPAASVR